MLGSLNLEPDSVFAEDYRIVRLLAAGGMGAVYVVDQLSTGKARALKVMRPELAGDEGLRSRFQQEARVGGRIESDHIVEIHSAGVDEATQTPYIIMELLSGEDLATRLERAGPLGPRETLDLFEQLCHAVAAAHDAGIVHRDLKPENVFLSQVKRAGDDGRVDVKVLDFGIAKLVAESATRGAAPTMGMIGTPLWMAPEQTERGPITPAADVWALGLILFRCLTGGLFWRSASDESATYAQILKEVVLGPIPPASVRAGEQGSAAAWPPALDVVFAQSVARDPARRYRDARVFGAALREALGRIAPPSSGRGLAAEPSSARILAGASLSSGLDATALPPKPGGAASPALVAAQTPRPDGGGGSPYRQMAPPPIVVPPLQPSGPALLSAPFSGSSEIAGLPARAVVIGIGLLLTIGSMTWITCARNRSLSQGEQVTSTTPTMLSRTLTPPGLPSPPARCRLCTGDVVVEGGLSRDGVVAAVEGAFPRLDAECLERSRRKPRAATVTLSFDVIAGAVRNRAISATSAKDGADECLVRGLSEIAFPSREEPTKVTYTLQFDPAVR